MTTWTTIPDASLDPNKPARALDGKALRDNPIAIAEGASGAPRIVGNAAKRRDEINLAVTAADTYSALVGFDTTTGQLSTVSTSYVDAYSATNRGYSGSVRVRATHNNNTFGSTSYMRVLKNGVQAAEWSVSGTTPTARSVDVAVAIGDVIKVQHRVNLDQSVVSAFAIKASDALVERKLYITQTEFDNA